MSLGYISAGPRYLFLLMRYGVTAPAISVWKAAVLTIIIYGLLIYESVQSIRHFSSRAMDNHITMRNSFLEC